MKMPGLNSYLFIICPECVVPPSRGCLFRQGSTIFLYSMSKIFARSCSRNASKYDYKHSFPIWQILMIARYGEFVTRYVKTELAITSATVQKGMSWSIRSTAKLILPVSKLRTFVIF